MGECECEIFIFTIVCVVCGDFRHRQSFGWNEFSEIDVRHKNTKIRRHHFSYRSRLVQSQSNVCTVHKTQLTSQSAINTNVYDYFILLHLWCFHTEFLLIHNIRMEPTHECDASGACVSCSMFMYQTKNKCSNMLQVTFVWILVTHTHIHRQFSHASMFMWDENL